MGMKLTLKFMSIIALVCAHQDKILLRGKIIMRTMMRTILCAMILSLLVVQPQEAIAGIKPMIQKIFEELVGSLGHSSSKPHYPNLVIQTIKSMPNGRIAIGIVHESGKRNRAFGYNLSDFTVPFETFYKETAISIYRFDPKKERFALWERHTLQQLDPMKSSVPAFYQKGGTSFSFVTEKKFQGTDTFGVVLESPQPESRYEDNSKLVKLTAPPTDKNAAPQILPSPQ